jgi:hypothetical protein
MTPDARLPIHQGHVAKSMPFGSSSLQSLAKGPTNPDLVEAPPGTDVLKLHEGLRKAESLLTIQLRTGTNGLNAFFF